MRTLIYSMGLALSFYSLGCSSSSSRHATSVAPVQSGSSANSSSGQGNSAPVSSDAVSGLYSLTDVHGTIVLNETPAGEQFSFVDGQGTEFTVADASLLAAIDAHPGSTLTLSAIAATTSSGPHRLDRLERSELDDVATVAARQLTQGIAPLPVIRSSSGEVFAVEGPLATQLGAAAMQVPLWVTGVRGATNAQGEVALRVTSWRYSRQVRYERYAAGSTTPTQVVSMDDLTTRAGLYSSRVDQAATNGDLLYVVQAGDTLGGIAGTYMTTVAAIAARNSIANVNVIAVGMQLSIPGAGQASPAIRRGGDGALSSAQRQGIDALLTAIDFTTAPRQFVSAQAGGFREVLRYGDSASVVEIQIEEGAAVIPTIGALRDYLRDFDQASTVSQFERLERGLDSAITVPAIYVIRDAATLATVWQQHDPTGATPLPAVDFTQESLVAVFLGTQATVGGVVEGVRVESLRRMGSSLVLDTQREEIGGVVLPTATPYEVVRVTLAGATGRVFTDRAF